MNTALPFKRILIASVLAVLATPVAWTILLLFRGFILQANMNGFAQQYAAYFNISAGAVACLAAALWVCKTSIRPIRDGFFTGFVAALMHGALGSLLSPLPAGVLLLGTFAKVLGGLGGGYASGRGRSEVA